MRVCRASMLAAVGWYLLMPPGSRTLRMSPRPPEANWAISSQYDSSPECEQARQHLIDSASERPPTYAPRSLRSSAAHTLAQRYLQSRCVAADDPVMHQLRPKSKPDAPN